MIRIHLKLDPDRESLYEEAVSRLRDVELTDVDADALVTSNAAEARDSSLPCLLDQPEAYDTEELKPLLSVRTMPGHEWRFLPSVLPAQECHAAGNLGKPGLLRIHHWIAGDKDPHRAAFSQIDLAHWFFGAAPSSTHVLSRPRYLQYHLGFPNDGMAIIDVATGRPGPDSYYSMHLIGSTGAAYADDHRNAHLLLNDSGPKALLHEQNRLLGIQNMLGEFVSGIRDQRPWTVSVQDSVNAQLIIEEAAHV